MITILDATIGTKFEVEQIDSLGGRVGSTYTSQLLDIKDVQHIVIAVPIQESQLMFIPSGSKIRCMFLHNKYGMLSFTGTVSGKAKQENVLVMNVEINSRLFKIQRRNHYRLDYMLDVRYRLISKYENLDESISCNIEDYTLAYTKNISGCGACIITDNSIERGDCVQLIFELENGIYIDTKCIVARCTAIEDVRPAKYSIGLSFMEISPKDQDAIVRFIFDKQKQLLKNKE